MEPFLRVEALSRAYDGRRVLDQVSLDLAQGTIVGILGENGAGKSTLARLLAGWETPDGGHCSGRARVRRLVPQYPLIHPEWTLEDLILLGQEGRPWWAARPQGRPPVPRDRQGLLQPWLQDLVWGVPVRHLPAAQVQRAAVAAALWAGPDLLILDEPSASLPETDTQALLSLLKTWSASGGTAVYITHRLDEALELCDRLAVLRQGRLAADRPRAAWTTPDLQAAMTAGSRPQGLSGTDRAKAAPVGPTAPSALPGPGSAPGSEVPAAGRAQAASGAPAGPAAGPEALPVSALSLLDLEAEDPPRRPLGPLSFRLAPGEILGLAGLRDQGLDLLEDVLAGVKPARRGLWQLRGEAVPPGQPAYLRRHGFGYVPADRFGRGAVLEATLLENLVSHRAQDLHRAGILWPEDTRTWFSQARQRFAFEGQAHQSLATLSGGNVQKLILSRELDLNPSVILLSEPSWGLDWEAKALLHSHLRELAREGKALLVLSSDLEELLQLADRIGVLYEGRLLALEARDQWTEDRLGRALLGGPL